MQYLTAEDVLRIHALAIERYGGSFGIRNHDALYSAVEQPRVTFGGEDLYPSVFAKASAIGYGLVRNHPFVDGNKRTGFTPMVVFLLRNGFRLRIAIDEAEAFVLGLAEGRVSREELAEWLRVHSEPISE